jgi:hypothetical protein
MIWESVAYKTPPRPVPPASLLSNVTRSNVTIAPDVACIHAPSYPMGKLIFSEMMVRNEEQS